ncbi:hypothetical protein PFISCL1PPCAC_16058, partial [Pristionchus fissidentatus]
GEGGGEGVGASRGLMRSRLAGWGWGYGNGGGGSVGSVDGARLLLGSLLGGLLGGGGASRLVRGHLLLVSLLVLGGSLLPLGLVLDSVPFNAGGLGDIDDAHAGLGDSGAVVLQPEHVGGHAALGRIGVLCLLDGLLGRGCGLRGLGDLLGGSLLDCLCCLGHGEVLSE